ncbi:MAG: hypothetical protein A2Y65_00700 [Deltaproteobacteria bacterium RBG_13_52_11]|nr:MAG: hypothetical protein A2Y65_00700 [Deltaproteobacteria bacterium RBG_13_52_11]
MRVHLIWIVITLFLIPTTAFAIKWERGGIDIMFSSEVSYQDITGNEEKSTLQEGWLYTENLILDLKQELAEKAKFQGYGHIRSSNDLQQQIAGRDWMFVEGYVRLADNLDTPTRYEIRAGDYAESYTPYTFNTSLLGTKAFYKFGEWAKVSTFWGKNRDEKLDAYARYSAGGRVELYYKEYLTIGGTFVYTDVARDSLEAGSTVGDQYNQVFGADLHLKLWQDRIHLEAEYARSIYNADRRDDTLMDQGDNAIVVRGDISPVTNLKISAEFERVEPWFNSVLGAASADLQRSKAQVDYTPWDFLNTMLMHEYSFNKLSDHSLEQYRTHTHLTSFSSTITPFLKREDVWNSLTVALQVDHTNSYTDDYPRTTDQDDLTANCTVSQTFPQWNYSLGYTHARNWNRVDKTSEFYSHAPTASLGITYPWLALMWAWTFNASYEYKEYTLSGLIDRTYRGDGGLALSYEKTRSTLGLTVAMEYYDNASGSPLGTADNMSRTYGIAFDQVLKETEAFTANLTLRASYKEYDEDAPDQDYNEGVYYCGLTVKF